MTLFKRKLLSLILVLFIAGCIDKDELTLPVKVYFKVGISSDISLKTKYLNLFECRVGIQSIQFEGKREAGGDIFFETVSTLNMQTLSFLQPIIISDFDIPQGIYNSMKWDISMKCIDTEGLIDDNDEESSCIVILISGDYTYMDGSVIPFIFAISEPVQFSVLAYNLYGDSEIALSVNKEYEATVLITPENAFNSIPRQSFEKAGISGEIGYTKIIISSSNNEDLYEFILNRIFQSAKVIVK
jgi:hypothetical protein